jgi:hypothetical protein
MYSSGKDLNISIMRLLTTVVFISLITSVSFAQNTWSQLGNNSIGAMQYYSNYGGNLGYAIRTASGGGWAWQYVDGANNPYFHVEYPTGYVGIGTTSPAARLHVYSPSTDGSTRIYGGIIGSGHNGYEMNLVGGIPPDGYPTASGGHIRLGGPARGDASINVIQFLQNGAERMRINNGGNVGIGTTAPGSKLVVVGATAVEEAIANFSNNVDQDFHVRVSAAGATNKRTIIGPSTSNRFSLGIGVTSNNEYLTIINGGNVGIGTTSPDQKLTVNGTVHATRVKVETTVPGPDYVFEESYSLPTLDEVKSYIDENKHLPELPSAKEMEAKGIDVGEMNMLLLKKVEELTLYVIELKKLNEATICEMDKMKTEFLNQKK